MDALPQNLFQLMLQLSLVQNPKLIIESFLKSMNSIFTEVRFFEIASGNETSTDSIEIKTPFNSFGRIAIEYGQLILPVSKKRLIYNAVDMLAILLENRVQQEKLAFETNQLKKEWQKQSENLHELDEQYKALAENSEDMILRFNNQYNIIYANSCTEKLFETSRNSLLNKDIRDLKQPLEQIEFWTSNLEKVFALGISLNENLVLANSSGKLFYNVKFVPEKAEDGEVNFVFASARDITELKHKEKMLYESQWHLKQAQRIAKIGSWEWNIKYNRIILSDELYNILGLSNQSSIKSIDDIKNFISSEFFQKIKSFQSTLPPNFESYEKETTIIRADNFLRHCIICVEPILDSSGKIKKLHGTLQDITERKLMESELKKAKLKAEESDRLKTSFLANMSHEIRTPLNGILGFTQLLRNRSLTDEKRKFYTDIICSNGKQLLNVISDIIDISRIESGQIIIEKSNCYLDNVFYELTDFVRTEIIAKGKSKIDIISSPDPHNPGLALFCDEIHLKQVMTNLLSNAVKFTSVGQIIFGYEVKDDKVEFFVCDTGIGIKSEFHHLIFERFRQANDSASREHGGTGLGLAICKSLVELMGGHIWLDSQEGIGSEFRFSLPLIPGNDIYIFPLQRSATLNVWTNKQFLIVEDDLPSVQLLKETLFDTFATVHHAEDGEKALTMFQNLKPDIILMDIRLPKLNGLEVIKTIRSKDKTIPIIAITANAFAEDKASCFSAGANDYVSKPFERIDLLSKIESLLPRNIQSKTEIAEI